MRGPYTQLYVHLVWATWDRLPLLVPDVERRVYANMRAKCDELGMAVRAMGGMPDHVHVLVCMPPVLSVSEAVRHLKGASSYFEGNASEAAFKWQGGYGAFTVSKRGVSRVTEYIRHQREHHAGHDTVDEYEVTEVPPDAP